ncbi:MAG TPA: hypothetical protein VM576_04350 [Xanthomonadaceae bacterium]|nr:hypothetical protein [Xanthomonadaceae bacterium]
MSDLKKDHSIGEGAGAVTGAVAGAAIGSVAGPVGTVIGTVAGGVVGAKAGGGIAEAVNPTEYTRHFENTYRERPYYASGREWSDYQPAYQYGYDTYGAYRGQRFDDVEDRLAQDWDTTRGNSRLAWGEAREAVRDGWHHIERAMPGDADRDGR